MSTPTNFWTSLQTELPKFWGDFEKWLLGMSYFAPCDHVFIFEGLLYVQCRTISCSRDFQINPNVALDFFDECSDIRLCIGYHSHRKAFFPLLMDREMEDMRVGLLADIFPTRSLALFAGIRKAAEMYEGQDK